MAMKTNLDRVEIIIGNVKEQAILINELEEKIKKLEQRLAERMISHKETDIIKLKNGSQGRSWEVDELRSHIEETRGFFGISVINDNLVSKVHYKNPETGKDTTMTRKAENLVDAVIKRNESAATLLKQGLIDFEYFLRVTQG